MPLPKESYTVRPASKFETSMFEVPDPNKQYMPKKNPEGSKYYELWCDIEDILVKGEDVVIESSDDHYTGYYTMKKTVRGLKRLSRLLNELGRIDFSIVTRTYPVYERSGDLVTDKGSKEPTFKIVGSVTHIRAIFPGENP